jgi:hypothetical protein
MTGCVAVVSLAMGGPRASWAEQRGIAGNGSPRGAWQTSRFGLAETLHRLEACAERHGLGVLVRWTPSDVQAAQELPSARAAMAPRSEGAVLVFESLNGGGTPVVMHGDELAPDLPLSLRLRCRADGCAEVLLPALPATYGAELPPEVARELTELPALVADALA